MNGIQYHRLVWWGIRVKPAPSLLFRSLDFIGSILCSKFSLAFPLRPVVPRSLMSRRIRTAFPFTFGQTDSCLWCWDGRLYLVPRSPVVNGNYTQPFRVEAGQAGQNRQYEESRLVLATSFTSLAVNVRSSCVSFIFFRLTYTRLFR